jgi:hypothetical protein
MAAAEADFGAFLMKEGYLVPVEPGVDRPMRIDDGEIVLTYEPLANFTSRPHRRSGETVTAAGAKVLWFHEYQPRHGARRYTLYVGDYGDFRLAYAV